ncbi:MAG: MotA/TolQ/ExbB proton channel family protein [Ignavibacteriales bacterium]|nr:MotA/TolQ/ExbB proton channel family protein [Ignavibacteriota bacterium]MCB9249177.1 MotA/TolQ/ExbB proton channel family protein [Ignavibacteriales bacterium]
MSLLSILSKGGWLMIPLVIISFIAVVIIVERYIVIKKSKLNVPAFLVKIRGMLIKKDISGAMSYCIEEKSSAANIIKSGLKKYHLGQERVKESIENAGRQEVAKLEKGLTVVATIAGIAPLIGFLGTVTGMIQAFMRIEDLQGSANPSDLAGGIWEALITTAVGLAIGIIALGFYNYLTSAINKLVLDMEVVSNDVVDIIEETNSGRKVREEDIEIEL